jgi:hypothetical protein
MAEVPLFLNTLSAERYLMSVSPEAVFNWFMTSVAERKEKFRPSISDTFEKELMQRLLARQEPLIDLAIASYCDNAEVLEALWRSGDQTIKVAIATNTFRRGFAGLPTTTFEEVCNDPALVRAVFENPSMVPESLANFLERSENFKSLSDEDWLSGLHAALRNPVLKSVPEEDQFSDDGYLDYSRRRPFGVAWELLVVLEATDRHAAILSDAFLNIAVFSPPYEEMLKAEGKLKAQNSLTELSPKRLAEFSERYERGTRLYLDYVFHKWRDTKPPSDEEGKWPTDRGFIRQGLAAGAARVGYQKNVVAYLRDHPDKWVRAGYYTTFQFADETSVRSAYDKDGAFFTEHAVYNKALYRNTPVGRSFSALVGVKLGGEWKDFSDDQMRRSIYHHSAMRFWKENPLVYPHPDDDLDALQSPPFKQEKDETVLEFMWRRADALKQQNDARLSQISTWLQEAPQEPQRVLPLIAELVASLYSEVQMCVTTLETAFEDTAGKRRLALASLPPN